MCISVQSATEHVSSLRQHPDATNRQRMVVAVLVMLSFNMFLFVYASMVLLRLGETGAEYRPAIVKQTCFRVRHLVVVS